MKCFFIDAAPALVHVMDDETVDLFKDFPSANRIHAACGGWTPKERLSFIEGPATCLECIARMP